VSTSRAAVCYCEYDFWDYRGYACIAQNVYFQSEFDHLIIEGEHFPLDNDTNVRVVTIKNSKVNFIPSAILDKFKNLNELMLSQVSLQTLTVNSLKNCGTLKSLCLEYNELQELRSGVFNQCGSLERLRLGWNKILHIEADAFQGLDKLYQLELQLNYFQTLPSTVLYAVPSLVTFIVGGPNFTDIHPDTFRQSRLSILQIIESPIKEIHRDLLKGQEKLSSLVIYHTQLDKLHPGTFDDLTSLRQLMIHYGRLTEIPAGVFKLNQLTSLDMAWHRIASMDPNAFVGLPNLEYFYISENRMRTLDGRLLRNNQKLRYIDISSNQLQAIERTFFGNQASLQWLDARYNTCVDKKFDYCENFATQVSPYFRRCFSKFDEQLVG
jgi:Leucine-rich repeat (LRR) protein